MSAAKRATQQAEDVRRETELKSLEKQGQMMRTATLDGANLWSKAVQSLPVEQMKFTLNAAVDTLPHNATLLPTWRLPITSHFTLHPLTYVQTWSGGMTPQWLAELTVCFETSFEEARERKEAKFSELVSATERAGYTTTLITLEVG